VSKAQAQTGKPVWQYHFDYDYPGGQPVSHNSELHFVFNGPGEAGNPKNAAPLQAYWINFARTGDPNGNGLTQWPRYDVQQRAYLAFTKHGQSVGRDLRSEVCWIRNLP